MQINFVLRDLNILNLIHRLELMNEEFRETIALGYLHTIVIVYLVKRNSPDTICCIPCTFGYTVVCNSSNLIFKIGFCKRQISRVSRIRRSFAVDENALPCLRIENKKRICYFILSDMKATLVFGYKIVVIKQVLRKIIPLRAVDGFKGYYAKILNINLVGFSFKSCFVCNGYSPPKYSLN